MTAQSPLTTLRPLHIRHETADKDRFMPLLLLGDEQREAVERYLYAGDLYVGSVKGEDMAVCVVCVVCVVCAGTGANGADTHPRFFRH